jgi:hypothetical protein
MELDLHDGLLAVCRLGADAPLPVWAASGGGPLHAVVRTSAELSIVTEEGAVPGDVAAERGWRAIAVRGPLDFGMTGVLADLARPLADAEVPIFAISTYDTDWILVPGAKLDDAVTTLTSAGHHVYD